MKISHFNEQQITNVQANNSEAGKTWLKPVAIIACGAMALVGMNSIKDSIVDRFDAIPDVITEGETTIEPPVVTEAKFDASHEIMSYKGKVEGDVVAKIRKRGLFGYGANATCEYPYEMIFTAHPEGEITGDVTTATDPVTKKKTVSAEFEVPSELVYETDTYMVNDGPGKKCKEGALASTIDVMGGKTTDLTDKAKKGFNAKAKTILTKDMPYSDEEGKQIAECATAGSVAEQAEKFNRDRKLPKKNTEVILRGHGQFGYEECVVKGSAAEAKAWKTGLVEDATIKLKGKIEV